MATIEFVTLQVADPTAANRFYTAAIDAGAMPLKPAERSLWGYGGVVRAPDGTI